ncbi:hypothetical protein [Epilithonimonas lactis]|uniref:hypothetical protein n=1 Tax=Epilithonimonas lactis TaxID=421072 RepID=UPI0008D52FE3|nr:hypothetical protein [Epilithonimonas lactis]SER02668.1 hypothetical protein SAMN04488097_3696 [Epilithonimonas lactis]
MIVTICLVFYFSYFIDVILKREYLSFDIHFPQNYFSGKFDLRFVEILTVSRKVEIERYH